MGTKAYSYLRFSSPTQMHGDSRRRQTALAQAYASEHGLVLDDDLKFHDLGVSAYRSKNAKAGALRAFLEAVENGLVPTGSLLLVESLDRISRDQILSAQGLFLQIIEAGVTLVTLMDGRRYSVASINANPFDLVISLMMMMRANEESATKGRRLRDAWVKKRVKALSEPMTSSVPGLAAAGQAVEAVRRAGGAGQRGAPHLDDTDFRVFGVQFNKANRVFILQDDTGHLLDSCYAELSLALEAISAIRASAIVTKPPS